MKQTKVLRPNWFRGDWPTVEMPRGGEFFSFNPLSNEELAGENDRKRRILR